MPSLAEQIQDKLTVTCPQCKHSFALSWDDTFFGEAQRTLRIHSCPSGGVYMVTVNCPICGLEEEL